MRLTYTFQNHEDGRFRAAIRNPKDRTEMKVLAVGDWRYSEYQARQDAARLIGKLLLEVK